MTARKMQFQLNAAQLDTGSPANEVRLLQVLLTRYGYLRGPYVPGQYDEPTRRAVAQYQSFYDVDPEADGACRRATIDLLNRPRCGVPDPDPGMRFREGRLAPFVTVGAKWNENALAFRFLNSSPDLPEQRQRDIIRESFARWAAVSSLTFPEVGASQASNLSVAFHRGDHGDGYPFDEGGGPSGNTLAHAFFPPPSGGTWAGSLHFDEFETWKDQPGGQGIRLYNVSLHEIGHLLGLGHSQDSNAIMYAYYGEDRNDLRADDVAGIQSLYGGPPAAPTVVSLGETVAGHLATKDAETHYQLTFNDKLLFRLNGPTGTDFDLFIRYGAPVDRQQGKYDQVSWGITSDELITVPNPKAGTYYVLVHSYEGTGSYQLEVEAS